MAIEKEMKLALGGTPPEAIGHWLQQAAQAADSKPAENGTAHATGTTFTLQNIYYDTPGLALARGKIALRLRRAPRGWLQTLKTAGKSVNGLHARGEWEMPVSGPALDLDALRAACDDAEALAALQAFDDAGIPLIPVFRTDFQRTVWHVETGGAKIEVALDLGKVFVPEQGANTQPAQTDRAINGDTDGAAMGTDDRGAAASASASVPIEELELELQGGAGDDESNEAALLHFAEQLRSAFPGLRADDTSKAARGYTLFVAHLAETRLNGGATQDVKGGAA